MDVIWSPAAADELVDAAEYYDEQTAGLGDEFLAEIEAAVTAIREFPQAWQLIEANVRRCLLRRLPYGLVYTVSKRRITIVATMHLRRAPGYWKKR